MIKKALTATVAGVALLFIMVMAGLSQQTPVPAPAESGADAAKPAADERSIVVHCGSSMRLAAEDLAPEFLKRYRTAVHFNFGGVETLLPQIELGVKGDMFICHDPYAEMLTKKGGLLVRYKTVGYLEPTIIVPVGNPAAIHSLADLAKPGLKVGLPDARFATAGQLVWAALGKIELADAVRKNIRMESRTHNDVAMALVSGHIDAGVVWNFIARSYKGRLEWVDPGCDFPETRVTVCLLQNTTDREMAEKFMEFATSAHSRAVFENYGYVKRRP